MKPEFAAWVAEQRARRARRAVVLETLVPSLEQLPVRIPGGMQTALLVHRSARVPGLVQITCLLEDGRPIGHTEHESIEAARLELLTSPVGVLWSALGPDLDPVIARKV